MVHTVEWFLENLEGVEGDAGQYQAWCPAHADIGTSVKGLSITVTTSGKILIRCHSCGATLPEVVEALEGEDPYALQETDFRPKVNKRSSRNGTPRETEDTVPTGARGMAWWVQRTGVPEKVWTDAGCFEFDSGVAFTFAGSEMSKIRRPPKEFVWIGGGERPPLWPAPEDEMDGVAYITEGESDCGTLRATGRHAYSITAGAGKSKGEKRYLSKEHFEALKARGVKAVVLAGDADPSGTEMMATLAGIASSCGLDVSVVRLDLVLDPFSGINDLNGMWKECLKSDVDFEDLFTRATQQISAGIPVITLEEMMEIAEEEIDYIIPGLIAPSDKVLISGPQKSYKTWVTLDLMRSIVTGSAFLNRPEWVPSRPSKALFVQEEGSRKLWARRIKKLGLPKNSPAIFWHRRGFRFTDDEKVAALIDTCRREGVEVLILDPMQRMIPGVNENDSSETGIVWDVIMQIQESIPGIVCIILHHSNKSERLTWESVRGSSRHAGEVDLGIFLEKHPIEDNLVRIAVDGRDIPRYLGTGESFEARIEISDDEAERQHFKIDATEIKVNVVNTGQLVGKKNRDVVMHAIEAGADTRSKLMRATDLSDNTIREHLNDLIELGVVVEVDNGQGKARTYVPSTVPVED